MVHAGPDFCLLRRHHAPLGQECGGIAGSLLLPSVRLYGPLLRHLRRPVPEHGVQRGHHPQQTRCGPRPPGRVPGELLHPPAGLPVLRGGVAGGRVRGHPLPGHVADGSGGAGDIRSGGGGLYGVLLRHLHLRGDAPGPPERPGVHPRDLACPAPGRELRGQRPVRAGVLQRHRHDDGRDADGGPGAESQICHRGDAHGPGGGHGHAPQWAVGPDDHDEDRHTGADAGVRRAGERLRHRGGPGPLPAEGLEVRGRHG